MEKFRHELFSNKSKSILERSRSMNNVYKRPGIITNDSLVKDGRSMHLKEDMVEHFDYEAVHPKVW
jgi:hypothetical protein